MSDVTVTPSELYYRVFIPVLTVQKSIGIKVSTLKIWNHFSLIFIVWQIIDRRITSSIRWPELGCLLCIIAAAAAAAVTHMTSPQHFSSSLSSAATGTSSTSSTSSHTSGNCVLSCLLRSATLMYNVRATLSILAVDSCWAACGLYSSSVGFLGTFVDIFGLLWLWGSFVNFLWFFG